MDRFDCQFLMATFVNVYIHSFIRMASIPKLLQQIYMVNYNHYYYIFYFFDKKILSKIVGKKIYFQLKPEDQLQLYYSLNESLTARGILQH